MSTPASPFFMSYSREDVSYQKRVIAELRQRGISVWVDTENLIPGSPAWEREIERAIRAAAGIIVLLSPDSNNSEWVRREISFAEQNNKRIFPVLIRGDEDDSIPLRLSSHQRVDRRRQFNSGLDQLAGALKDHLGVTAVHRIPKQRNSVNFNPSDLKKFILPGFLAMFGLACLGGLSLAASFVFKNIPTPSQVMTTPPDVDPLITETAVDVVIDSPEPTGKIVYTCNLEGADVCIINANGSDWQRLTNTALASFNASLSPGGDSVVFVTGQDPKSEIYELHLNNGELNN
jgi:hypothetical protein